MTKEQILKVLPALSDSDVIEIYNAARNELRSRAEEAQKEAEALRKQQEESEKRSRDLHSAIGDLALLDTALPSPKPELLGNRDPFQLHDKRTFQMLTKSAEPAPKAAMGKAVQNAALNTPRKRKAKKK